MRQKTNRQHDGTERTADRELAFKRTHTFTSLRPNVHVHGFGWKPSFMWSGAGQRGSVRNSTCSRCVFQMAEQADGSGLNGHCQ